MRTLAPSFTGLALVLVLLAGALPGASHPIGFPGTGAEECGGFAPFQTQCHDGPHVWALTMEHTVFAADDYTGIIVSTLQGLPQDTTINPIRSLRCAFEDGTALGCVERFISTGPTVAMGPVEAGPPDLGRVVTHTCKSLELPESKDPGEDTGAGGEGGWLCQIRHR